GKKIGKDVVRAVDDDVAKSTVDSKTLKMVGGRFPINSKYAGKTFELAGDLGKKYPNGVKFTNAGFPDFSPYSKANIQIKGLTGNYTIDAAKANKLVGLSDTPSDFVWHHVEDGLSMQLVPKDLHWYVKHTGGSAVIRHGGR
ncbi:MAG: HNH endonuclease, partial [Leptospiraceae bacterium]|nr:HNH endonuclease [Leptospiraceae bacterium]